MRHSRLVWEMAKKGPDCRFFLVLSTPLFRDCCLCAPRRTNRRNDDTVGGGGTLGRIPSEGWGPKKRRERGGFVRVCASFWVRAKNYLLFSLSRRKLRFFRRGKKKSVDSRAPPIYDGRTDVWRFTSSVARRVLLTQILRPSLVTNSNTHTHTHTHTSILERWRNCRVWGVMEDDVNMAQCKQMQQQGSPPGVLKGQSGWWNMLIILFMFFPVRPSTTYMIFREDHFAN